MRKLSEIKGKGAISAFATIIDPICNIAEDAETRELYKKEHCPEGRDEKSYMLQQLFKILSKHEDDFTAIMAVCYETTPEEYKATLSYAQALSDWADLISDPVWKAFFIQARSAEIRSGSAQENIKAHQT